MTDDVLEIRDALGRVLGWIPTDVARGLGIDVADEAPISVQERRKIQAHPEYEPARQGLNHD